jgi:hypothetical protein
MWLSVGCFRPYFEISYFVGPHFSCCGTCLVGLLVVGLLVLRGLLISLYLIVLSHVQLRIPPSELWKLHRRLGHMSFDFLCQLSGLGLIRGLLMLVWNGFGLLSFLSRQVVCACDLYSFVWGAVVVFGWIWCLVWFAFGSGGSGIEKPCVLIATLLSLELGICHPYGLVWRGVVLYLVYLYLLSFSYIFFILT